MGGREKKEGGREGAKKEVNDNRREEGCSPHTRISPCLSLGTCFESIDRSVGTTQPLKAPTAGTEKKKIVSGLENRNLTHTHNLLVGLSRGRASATKQATKQGVYTDCCKGTVVLVTKERHGLAVGREEGGRERGREIST